MLDEPALEFSPVAITGAALVTALGLSAQETWQAILSGSTGAGPMPAMEAPLPDGADGFQAVELPAEYCPNQPREVRYLRWAIEAALQEAGLTTGVGNGIDPSRRSIVLGTTLHGMRAGGRFYRSGDFDHLQKFLAGSTLQRAIGGLGIGGGAMTTCSACSSSLGSVALGMTLLRAGEADIVIAGGYDTVSEYVWAGFNALRLVTQGPSRPFARDRRGMKLGEGYAIVVLERPEHAAARNAKILATVSGYGESADAHHLTQPHPGGEGALQAMRAALRQANVDAGAIDLISAHATGTPDNDAAEFAAMSKLLGDALRKKSVVCFKTHIGHTLGAAGAAELVLSAAALRDGVLPPTANANPAQIEYEGLHVTGTKPIPELIRHTLNTSLGFGGANTSVVLSKNSSARKPSIRPRREVWITGIGVVAPGAVGLDAFREKLSSPPSSIGDSETPMLPDEAYIHLLNARRVRRMSGYAKLMLAAATEACQNGKIFDDAKSLAQTGALLGTTHGASPFCHEYYSQMVRDGLLAANPVLFAEGVPNVGAAQLSLMLGLQGACQTLIGTRTTGIDALRMAWLRIATGEATRLIVGAAEESCEIVDRAYAHCGLRRDVSDIDAAQPGFITSPGAVAFIVESADSARARGATPHARIDAAAAGNGCATHLPRTLKRLLGRFGETSHWIGSANRTWLDAVEHRAFKRMRAPVTFTNTYDKFGEMFSVSPLIGIASVLAQRKFPMSVNDTCPGDIRRSFGVLCTDWLGNAASASLSLLDAEGRS